MKVSELMEAAGEADKLWSRMVKILRQEETQLKKKAGKQSSHSIGGNFSAVVSGNVGIRDNYRESGGRYGFDTTWNHMLEVGNNIEGGSSQALEEVKRIFDDLRDEAEDAGADTKIIGSDNNILHVSIDGREISAKYEYARSFCWVGLRVAK